MQLVLLICYHFQHMITYLLKRFLREKQKKKLRESYPSWFTQTSKESDAATAKAHVRTKQRTSKETFY